MTDTWMAKIKPPVALRHCPWCHRPLALLENCPGRYHLHCLSKKCPVNPCTGVYENLEDLCKDWNSMRP